MMRIKTIYNQSNNNNYNKVYDNYKKWCAEIKYISKVTEKVFMVYFSELAACNTCHESASRT